MWVAVVLTLLLSLLLSVTVSAETAGWIKNADGSWSYMNDDGQLVKGETSYWIEGACYGFDANGIMYTGWVQPHKAELWFGDQHRDAWYFFESNGHAPEYGYHAATGYLFYSDGQVMTNGCAYYNDRIFLSDENGVATEVTGSGWQSVNGKWCYIAVDEYGNRNIYIHDRYIIGGTEYFFRNGYLASNEWFSYEQDDEMNIAYADANGVPVYAGWINDKGDWCYIQDGETLQHGTYLIGGNYYYFDYNGVLVENDVVYDYTIGATVCAKSGGSLYRNEWRQTKDGEWEYYDDTAARVEGDGCVIGDTVYYFDYDGVMVTNDWQYYNGDYYLFGASGAGTVMPDGWYWDSDAKRYMYFEDGYYYSGEVANIGGTLYAFDWDGYLYDTDTCAELYGENDWEYYSIHANGTVNTTAGWDMTNRGWVYIENGVLKTGWQLLGGTWYYLDPYMYTNTHITENGNTYYFRSDGTYINVTVNGLYKVSSYSTYYFENGSPLSGWKQIGGKWYYFNYTMFTDGVYTIGDSQYYFDQDGVMQTGWIARSGNGWRYADASGNLYTGIQTIDGTRYAFDEEGNLLNDAGVEEIDGVEYVVNDSGVVVADGTQADGWYQDPANGNYYYLEDGEFCRGWSQKLIGSQRYGFDTDGVMRTNEIYNGCYYQANGAVYTDGWFMRDGKWYYAFDYGQLASGVEKIDGKYYYFYAYQMQLGTFVYDDLIVFTDGSGAVAYTQKFTEGWNLVSEFGHGVYYYVQDGNLYTGWVGDCYVDEWEGMICGRAYTIDDVRYYFQDNGAIARSTWIQDDDGDWRYAKANGELCEDEWLLIGSTWYYFNGVWMAEDGTYEIDGKYHAFAKGGAWLGEVADPYEGVNLSEGWHTIDGKWYYIQNGNPVYDTIRKIDGVWYGFNDEAYMVTNGFNGRGYYMNASGVMVEYTGWQIIQGRWVYFTTEHQAVSGWFTVGGTRYFADAEYIDEYGTIEIGMVTGYQVINDRIYNFASGGACLGQVTTDGWYLVDSHWYYVQNGQLVTDDIVSINGVRYAFAHNGQMIANDYFYDEDTERYVLFGASGAQVTTTGWYMVDGEWFYVDTQGYLLSGSHVIGGVGYYFNFNYYYYY